jgi:hypothetical protein
LSQASRGDYEERDARCSWDGCENAGVYRQKATDGEQWAFLCETHNGKVDGSIDAALKEPSEVNIKTLLGSWVKAQGGAKAATDRVLGVKETK